MSFQQAQIYTTNSYHFEYKTNLKYEIKTKNNTPTYNPWYRSSILAFPPPLERSHTLYQFTHGMISHEMPVEIRMCVAVVSTR